MLSQDPGPHGISADPRYINPDEGNYHLQANSPCIEGGNPSYAVPRRGGNRIDIGAFEYLQSMCGDINEDSTSNAGDAVHLVNYIFKTGPPPMPIYAGDVNCDGETNIGDAVYMIVYVFKGGSPPCGNCE